MADDLIMMLKGDNKQKVRLLTRYISIFFKFIFDSLSKGVMFQMRIYGMLEISLRNHLSLLQMEWPIC